MIELVDHRDIRQTGAASRSDSLEPARIGLRGVSDSEDDGGTCSEQVLTINKNLFVDALNSVRMGLDHEEALEALGLSEDGSACSTILLDLRRGFINTGKTPTVPGSYTPSDFSVCLQRSAGHQNITMSE